MVTDLLGMVLMVVLLCVGTGTGASIKVRKIHVAARPNRQSGIRSSSKDPALPDGMD